MPDSNSKPPSQREQIKKLEEQAAKAQHPSVLAAIRKKIAVLKSQQDVKK